MSERAATFPVGAYIVSTGPAGPMLDFDELKVAMSRAVEKATRHVAGSSPAVGAGDDGASG
jgi:hypothetical protein